MVMDNLRYKIINRSLSLEIFFEMIHEYNDQWHHHPPSEGEYVPEAIALTGTRGDGGWPTVHYGVG